MSHEAELRAIANGLPESFRARSIAMKAADEIADLRRQRNELEAAIDVALHHICGADVTAKRILDDALAKIKG